MIGSGRYAPCIQHPVPVIFKGFQQSPSTLFSLVVIGPTPVARVPQVRRDVPGHLTTHRADELEFSRPSRRVVHGSL